MTNIEFFKDELLKMVETRNKIAIVKGKPTNCSYFKSCENCDRLYSCNDAGLIKWLLSEHIEETENYRICKNLKIDDKVLVSYTGGEWHKRHFARYDSENDYVLTFDSGTTSWTTDEKHNIVHWKHVKLPEEGERNG